MSKAFTCKSSKLKTIEHKIWDIWNLQPRLKSKVSSPSAILIKKEPKNFPHAARIYSMRNDDRRPPKIVNFTLEYNILSVFYSFAFPSTIQMKISLLYKLNFFPSPAKNACRLNGESCAEKETSSFAHDANRCRQTFFIYVLLLPASNFLLSKRMKKARWQHLYLLVS